MVWVRLGLGLGFCDELGSRFGFGLDLWGSGYGHRYLGRVRAMLS